jgi:hypothetical protein
MTDVHTLNRSYSAAAGGRFAIEVRGDELAVSAEPDLAAAAEAIAAAVRDGIASGASRTGTLAAGITAERQPDGSYAIVPPPGRLDPAKFNSPTTYAAFRAKLAAIPAIAEPLSAPDVDTAIAASLDAMVR